MADRYFQCAMCKTLKIVADEDCYKTTSDVISLSNIDNETCDCAGTGCKRRMRELKETQFDSELALNRSINSGVVKS